MTYRLYIDESGSAGIREIKDERYRYLSLTGVIFEQSYLSEDVTPALEALKERYFGLSGGNPVCLHRKELIASSPPFECLKNHATRRRFNAELLALFEKKDYAVITVAIDKVAHFRERAADRIDPYHQCFVNLVGLYADYLTRRQSVGDVMSEARGKKEDRGLSEAFERLHQNGTGRYSASMFQRTLSSRQLKLKAKRDAVTGLEIADLLAHPSHSFMVSQVEKREIPENFGGEIARILVLSKYHRSSGGLIRCYGTRWLP